MIYLLDTNVVSEFMRPQPDAAVLRWIASIPRSQLWISSIVVAELLFGVDAMPAGKRQENLRRAVEAMIEEDFRGRIFDFDLAAARNFGRILLERQRIGRPVKEMDALIAATAAAHSATIATRNVRDFTSCGVPVVDPWSAA